MSINLGSTAIGIYLGSTAINAVYLGATQVFSASAISPLAAYAANGITPQLVAQFKDGVFGKASALSTFDGVLEHSRAGLATMVDSDGVLKWAPHNLVTYSEDFTNAAWDKAGGGTGSVPIMTANAGVAPDGTSTADRIQITKGVGATSNDYSLVLQPTYNWVAGQKANGRVWVKSNTASSQTILVYVVSSTTVTKSVISVGQDWTLISPDQITFKNTSIAIVIGSRGSASYGGDDSLDVLVWGAHLYRSDLGGMADNPDRGDSYVPTTTAARYLPRRGHHVYNGTSWVNEGLLHESDARTNLVEYSSEFDNAYWVTFGTSTSANVSTSPDGSLTADKLIESSANSTHGIRTSSIALSAGTYTRSVYAKSDGRRYFKLSNAVTSSQYYLASFDLQDGVVTQEIDASGGTITSGIEDFGNGWYRCSVTFSLPSPASILAQTFLDSSGTAAYNASYAGDGSSGVLFYGDQLEEGSTPSSYIPTSGAAATRAAETLTVPAANMPWPTPVVIGEELVTNGTFDDGTTGWSLSSAVISSGSLTFTPTAVGAVAFVTGADTVFNSGKIYQLTYDVLSNNLSSASVRINFGGGNIVNLASMAVGSHSQVIYGYGNISFKLESYVNVVGGAATIDNISVKEIDPLSVSIQMDGLMTYADDGGSIVFTARTNGATRIVQSLSTFGTYTGRPVFVQSDGTSADIVYGGVATYSQGVNIPFNIASRHGSTFLNGAVDGTSYTANLTPTALPYLQARDFSLAPTYMGTIGKLRVWSDDIGDTGIAEASA